MTIVRDQDEQRPAERDPAVAEERDLGVVGDETRATHGGPQSGKAAGRARSYQSATRKRLK